MIDSEDINRRIDCCKPFIKNWGAMEGIDFDFQDVRVDGLLVDKHPDERDEKWEISLLTTIPTHLGDTGKDEYTVRWRFRDLWGNLAFFTLEGYQFTGALCLRYIDYDDFAIIGFAIVKDGEVPIFKFDQPDEISIVSVEKTRHLTLVELYPEDYEPDLFNNEL